MAKQDYAIPLPHIFCTLIWPINKFHCRHKSWQKQIFSYIQPSFQKFCKSLISYRKIRVCQLIIYVRLMQNYIPNYVVGEQTPFSCSKAAAC